MVSRRDAQVSRVKNTLGPFKATILREENTSLFLSFPDMVLAARFIEFLDLRDVAFLVTPAQLSSRSIRFDLRVAVELVIA